ncbi:MAG TPA: hypothetical protein VFA41_05025 [Ktedonobacteraceae bacterium]|jgi:hypothetical protein|nr:hypothetical protein [Ktedonobacteraceae bacterium]
MWLCNISLYFLALLKLIVLTQVVQMRRSMPVSAEWNARIMMLQGIHQRLSLLFISSQAIEGVPVMFTAKELKELEEAIRSFASFVRQRIPASREREDVLQGVEYLRKQVASMLDR